MHPTPAPKLRHALVLASILLGLGSCGDDRPGPLPDSDGATSFARIDLDREALEAGQAVKLAELVASEAADAWTARAKDGVEFAEVDGRPVTALLGRAERKVVEIPLAGDLRDFNAVVIEAAADRGVFERIEVAPMRDDLNLVPTRLVELKSGAGLTALTAEFPDLRTRPGRPDALVLSFEGASYVGMLSRVTLLKQSAEGQLMDSEGLGRATLVGGVYRRSEHVTTAKPSRGRMVLGEGQLVELFVAADPVMLRPDETLTFRCVLSGGGKTTEITERAGSDGWKRLRFAPGIIPAGEAALEIELTSSVAGGMGVGLVGEAAVRSKGDGSRTVLLISSDTHRADHMGVASADSPVATPHLDALAAKGVHFTNCYSATNVTNPSHIALLTGIHPKDTTILNNRTRLSEQATTIAEQFAAAGYQTFASTSAFHLLDRHSGLGQGFDRMEGPASDQRDGEIAIEQLLEWIEEADGGPVFAWLHLFDAHEPYGPPEPYDRKYWDGGDPFEGPDPGIDPKLLPDNLKGLKKLDFPYAQYRAEVDYLDGALCDLLEHPRMKNAPIAFTADHGEAFGEHGIWWSHAGVYPHAIHIPLLLAGPGCEPGTTFDGPVRQIDVSRTLLEMAGVDPGDVGGIDLRTIVAGETATDPRFALGAHHFNAAIQADKWLLVMDLRPHFERALETMRFTGQCELYDLEADPGCENDLLLEEFDMATRLRGRLIEWLQTKEGPGFAETQRRSGEEEAMLRALGYSGDQTSEGSDFWNPRRWSRGPWRENPWNLLFSDEDYPRDGFRAAVAAWHSR